jgi:hypothetical protein
LAKSRKFIGSPDKLRIGFTFCWLAQSVTKYEITTNKPCCTHWPYVSNWKLLHFYSYDYD